MLRVGWKTDAVGALKVTLSEIQRRVPLVETKEQAEALHAIVGAAKIVGELLIACDALSLDQSSAEIAEAERADAIEIHGLPVN